MTSHPLELKISSFWVVTVILFTFTEKDVHKCWSDPVNASELTVDLAKVRHELDFGKLVAGEVTRKRIRFVNDGLNDAKIESIDVSCGCVKIVNAPHTVAPAGGDCFVDLEVRPGIVNEPFQQQLSLHLKVNEDQSVVRVHIGAKVGGFVKVDEDHLVYQEGDIVKPLLLTPTVAGSEILKCTPERGVLRCVSQEVTLNKGWRISFAAEIGQGSAVEMLRVKLKTAENQIKDVVLQLPVRIRKQVTFIPNQLILDSSLDVVSANAHVIVTGKAVPPNDASIEAFVECNSAGDLRSVESGVTAERSGPRSVKIELNASTEDIKGCDGIRVKMGRLDVLVPILWESDIE